FPSSLHKPSPLRSLLRPLMSNDAAPIALNATRREPPPKPQLQCSRPRPFPQPDRPQRKAFSLRAVAVLNHECAPPWLRQHTPRVCWRLRSGGRDHAARLFPLLIGDWRLVIADFTNDILFPAF